MNITIPSFWNLATESRLITAAQVEHLAIAFSQVKGAADQANARTLAEWLIAQNVLSRYQANVLLAGQPGPFWFGDYCVFGCVDAGSLAGAYRAVHGPTSHPVLLQFASAADVSDPVRWTAASRYSAAALSVAHPHLRRAYELVELGRFKFAVTEDPAGRSLDTFLAPGRPFPPPDACRLVRQIASALAAWHGAGLVHGSLVPDHVFATPAGNMRVVQPMFGPSLIDFALLGQPNDAARRLAIQLDYLAPEQFQPGRQPDTAADIYALGCLLFQMLAGCVPFPGGDVRQKALAHATQPIANLAALGVPQPLVQVVSYMMAKDPAVRYSSAAQVADSLAPFIPPAALAAAVEAVPPTAAAYQSHLGAQNERPRANTEPASGLANVKSAAASKPVGTNLGKKPIALNPSISAATTTSFGSRKRSNLPTIAGITAAAVAAIGLALYLYSLGSGSQGELTAQPPKTDRRQDTKPAPPTPKVNPIGDNSRPSPPAIPAKPKPAEKKQPPVAPPVAKKTDATAPAPPPEEIIDDDQKTLWASPTHGGPLELKYIGLGAQAALILRPAELLADTQGAKIVTSLGPAGKAFIQTVESAIGMPLADAQQLTIALYPNGDLPPRASYVVRLKSETPEATLAKNWKNVSPSKTRDGKKLYAGEANAYYIPVAEKGRVFAAGAIETIQEVAELDGKEPTLVVPLVKLLRSADIDRHVTFVCEPRLLFGDGRKLFAGASEKLREPLSRFLGDDTQAVSTSLHLADDRLFLELRAIGRLEAKPDALAQSLQSRVANLPKQIDDFLLDTDVTRHSKKLLNRFPQMLRELVAYLRADADHDEAILRCYLPAAAAHNFARAAELALHEGSGAASPVAQAPTEPPATTLAAKLDKKITLAFPRDTLERSIELWATETGIKAVILGNDLQLDGITKNQSFGLDEKDQPALAVLGQILKKASPDGKLIYVIKPEQSGGPEVVFITTLAAAVKRGDKLPPGIQAPKTTPKRKV
jgi:serine/threonine protein kinase